MTHGSRARVLIAHQSTIPHYRVPFYEALEVERPPGWAFEVVFDLTELTTPRFFSEPLEPDRLTFPIRDTRTVGLRIGERRISYQRFWRAAASYDLVIVEHAVNNLAYPLVQLHQLRGTRVALWGTGRDLGRTPVTHAKRVAEAAKLRLARAADGYFAYTEGVRDYLVAQGLRRDRVWALGNTIDIVAQRETLERHRPARGEVRRELGVDGKSVLLFVGRFRARKRVDLLLEAFSALRRRRPDVPLLLVGDGYEHLLDAGLPDGVTYLGIRLGDDLARLYVASDLFVFPRAVGLGPLHAMCYDLPTVTIDGPGHGSEFEYLTPRNSVVLPSGSGAPELADALDDLVGAPGRLNALRRSTWASIHHLTIRRMARNFVTGVDAILRT